MTVIFPTLDSYHNSNVTVISKLSAFDNIHRDGMKYIENVHNIKFTKTPF